MWQLIRMAWRNSLRNWRYSSAAFGTIAVGLWSLVLYQGYSDGVNDMWLMQFQDRGMMGDIVVEAKQRGKADWAAMMDGKMQADLERVLDKSRSEIDVELRLLTIDGQVSLGSQSALFVGYALDRESADRMRGSRWQWNAVGGEPIKKARDIVVAAGLAKLLGCDVPPRVKGNMFGEGPGYPRVNTPFTCGGKRASELPLMLQTVTEAGQINASNYQFAGLVNSGLLEFERVWLMMDLEDGQRLYDTKKISLVTLRLKPGKSIKTFINRHKKELNSLGLTIVQWNDHSLAEIYQKIMPIFYYFGLFCKSILYSIVCLSVFNLMVKTIQERTREIGLLQTLGYGNQTVRLLFLFESMLSGLTGIAFGSVATLVYAIGINKLGIYYDPGYSSDLIPFYIKIDRGIWFATAGTLFVLIIFSTLTAIFHALRKSIVECLLS